MGYVSRQISKKSLIKSANLIMSNDAEAINSLHSDWILTKSILVTELFYPNASLTVKVDGSSTNGYCRIYYNGSPIGAVHATAGYATYSEDFIFTNLEINDTIEVWTAFDTGQGPSKVKNFRLYGDEYGFYNLVV